MSLKPINLKNKLEGVELDLSLMRLTEVPVTEIATIPKAVKIDLSNNELVIVPQTFANHLSHIIKLDLSSNKLRELPDNFGDLTNLKYLDLYNNQLTTLPLSLSNLENLKYLDVKNNPLRPDLDKAAGNCQNNKECQAAARNLLSYLRELKTEKEQEANLKAQKEKEIKLAKQKQRIIEKEKAMLREKKKADKKAAKEKKRSEEVVEVKQATVQNGSVVQNGKTAKKEKEKKTNIENKSPKIVTKSSTKKWSCLAIFNMCLLLGILLCTSFCASLYLEDYSVDGVKAAWPKIKQNAYVLYNMTTEALKFENLQATADQTWNVTRPYALKVADASILAFNAAKNLSFSAFQALQEFTGDLTPYCEGVKSFLQDFLQNCVWALDLAVSYLESIDWEELFGGVRWMWRFLVDQARVLNEELWKNEAISSLWDESKPYREGLWSTTETVRGALGDMYTEFNTSWLPVIQKESINLYSYARKTISSVFS